MQTIPLNVRNIIPSFCKYTILFGSQDTHDCLGVPEYFFHLQHKLKNIAVIKEKFSPSLSRKESSFYLSGSTPMKVKFGEKQAALATAYRGP